ncbi:hypothetical protein GNI_047820 [Gregarina niphandrodes]|uniref:Uncharacterized protein n=1 Tax=Gregarina niphandrodes TaxID=110365 RepID=A0A023B9S2_GRENI|nr:hypothetical protein GNI_047820 [Gregarina niphandrodes]EZG73993.1 hypothetical protein GNI_047820 [Gregarina niphandrodes]|eukprot:XP_011129635.1 hypothetical protein GNI_047820 [Gregarina niphandrodes]
MRQTYGGYVRADADGVDLRYEAPAILVDRPPKVQSQTCARGWSTNAVTLCGGALQTAAGQQYPPEGMNQQNAEAFKMIDESDAQSTRQLMMETGSPSIVTVNHRYGGRASQNIGASQTISNVELDRVESDRVELDRVELDRYSANDGNPGISSVSNALKVGWESFLIDHTKAKLNDIVDQRDEGLGPFPTQHSLEVQDQTGTKQLCTHVSSAAVQSVAAQSHALEITNQENAGTCSVLDEWSAEWLEYLTDEQNPGADGWVDSLVVESASLMMNQVGGANATMDRSCEELGHSPEAHVQTGTGQLSTDVWAPHTARQSDAAQSHALGIPNEHEGTSSMTGKFLDVEWGRYLTDEQSQESPWDVESDLLMMDQTRAGADSTVDQRCERPGPVLAGQPAESPGQPGVGQPCVGEDAVHRPDVLPGLTARVLSDCLAEGVDPVQPCGDEESKIVRRVFTCFQTTALERNEYVSFDVCTWRAYDLALFLRERLSDQPLSQSNDSGVGQTGSVARSQFDELVAMAEQRLRKPPGVSDTWFLACMIEDFGRSGSLWRRMPKRLPALRGWNSLLPLYRGTIPDGLSRLPQGSTATTLVSTASRLQFWLHQAATAFYAGKQVKSAQRVTMIVSTMRSVLGPKRFDEEIRDWTTRIPGFSRTESSEQASRLLGRANIPPGKRCACKLRNLATRAKEVHPRARDGRLPLSSRPAEPCVGEDAAYTRGVLQGLTARVLNDCLAEEVAPLQLSNETEANELVRHISRCFRGASREQNVNVSFAVSPYRALNLALFLRERLSRQSFVDSNTRSPGGAQTARSQFDTLVGMAQLMVRRPPGVGDTWFLACTMHAFGISDPLNLNPLNSELLKTLPAWSSNALLYRDTIPDDLPRLPQDKEAIRLVATASKLQFWLHQAAAAFRSGEPAAVNSFHRASLVSSLRTTLGPNRFDEEIDTWMTHIPPPAGAKLTACQRACWLLSWVDVLPKWMKGDAKQPAPPSRRSESASSWDAAADSGLRAFVATVIQERVEAERKAAERYGREWMDREGVLPKEGKREVAEFVAEWAVPGNLEWKKPYHAAEPDFGKGRWRWVHLAGVIKDQLDRSVVNDLVATAEGAIPRPAGVSPLWFLAAVLRTSAVHRTLDNRIGRWLATRDSGWKSSFSLHSDIFPPDFGPLPESQASRRVVALLCWAAHWFKSGAQYLGQLDECDREIKLRQSSVFGAAARFIHQGLGDRTFGQLVALFKPRLAAATISDCRVTECLLGCSGVTPQQTQNMHKQLPSGTTERKRDRPTEQEAAKKRRLGTADWLHKTTLVRAGSSTGS